LSAEVVDEGPWYDTSFDLAALRSVLGVNLDLSREASEATYKDGMGWDGTGRRTG
jgi:hypothetical protein